MDCRPGDNLMFPSTLHMLGLFTGLSPLSTNFPKKHLNCPITLPSYEVNMESCQPEGGCFPPPKDFSLKENNLSRVDNLLFICTSYEGNDCFIIPNGI